jgi:anti-sigma B factor antagonist
MGAVGSGLKLYQETIRDHPDALLVKVDGSIDPKTVTGFKNELQAVAAKGVKRFILDCAGLTYVNSSGLAYLLNLVGSVKPKGGGIAMGAVDSKIMVIFNMMGITQLFTFYPSAAAAVKDMDDKLAKELRDVGPALRLEEPPKPIAQPTPKPSKMSTSSIVGSRTERIRQGGSTRPVMLVQQENAFVRFFRALFGLEDSRPAAFRRRR